MNEGRAIPNSRNGQEVPMELGIAAFDIFKNYKKDTWILDDFDHYE